jgi:hypothetical protein
VTQAGLCLRPRTGYCSLLLEMDVLSGVADANSKLHKTADIPEIVAEASAGLHCIGSYFSFWLSLTPD